MGAGWSSCSEQLDARHHQQIFREAVHAVAFFRMVERKLPGLIAERGFVVEQRLDVSGDGGDAGCGARGRRWRRSRAGAFEPARWR